MVRSKVVTRRYVPVGGALGNANPQTHTTRLQVAIRGLPGLVRLQRFIPLHVPLVSTRLETEYVRSRIKKYAPRSIKRLVRRGIDREAQLELIVRASFHSRNLRLLVHELRRGCETSVEMYARLVHAW